MKLPRRQFLHLAAGAAALPAISQMAMAETYPTRPVHLISPFAPGRQNDIFARLIGRSLSQRLSQQFVIENRSSAGGNIGTEVVVKATPDGYTLLLVDTSNAFNATLYDNLSFNFICDIAPSLFRRAGVLIVHPALPVNSTSELVAYAKANPGKVTMAGGGIGSYPRVWGELFKAMAGVDMVQVQYRGGAPALVDMLGGHTQAMIARLPSSIGYVKAGRLRALAVTTMSRLEMLPTIPPIADTLPGFEVTSWTGVGAPKGVSEEIVVRLDREINTALADPLMKGRFAELGGVVFPTSPADFGTFVAEETERWGRVIGAAGIKAE